MGGFNIREEKLYKIDAKHSNDSNADKLPETIPREEIVPYPNEETKEQSDEIITGRDYTL